MPSASRNANRKRRQKRNLSLTRRALTHETISRAKTAVAFFAVLGKLGGEIEVSKRDFDQAVANLTKLNFVIEPSAVEGYFMVKLVTLTEENNDGNKEIAEAPATTPDVQAGEQRDNVQPAPEVSGGSEAPSAV